MKYEITAKQFDGSIVLTYNDKGIIENAEFNCSLTMDQLKFFATHFPTHQAWLKLTVQQIDGKFSEVIEKITFELFYEKYAVKEGKSKALTAWNKLKAEERTAAYKYISRYNSLLAQKQWQSKAMPATYLNQKRWLD